MTSHVAIFASILSVVLCQASPVTQAFAKDGPSAFFLRSDAIAEALVKGQIEEALEYYEATAKTVEVDAPWIDPARTTVAEIYANAAFATTQCTTLPARVC